MSLVDPLCQNFDSGKESHLVAHPCAHWVVRKLLEGERGGEEREITCNPSLYHYGLCSTDCFAELLLDKLPTNQIQAWVGTNRGAFVVCRYELVWYIVYCMWSHDVLYVVT